MTLPPDPHGRADAHGRGSDPQTGPGNGGAVAESSSVGSADAVAGSAGPTDADAAGGRADVGAGSVGRVDAEAGSVGRVGSVGRADAVGSVGAGMSPGAGTSPGAVEPSPARRYKALLAEMTAGLAAREGRNADRITTLEAVVRERGVELDAAADRYTATRVVNELTWEAAVELLWVESWLTMRPYPRPDRFAAAGADVAADGVVPDPDEVAHHLERLRRQVQRRGL